VVVSAALAPALVVPDEQTWAIAGVDPAALGLEPAFAPGAARHVLLPKRIPEPLGEPVAALLAGVPSAASLVQAAIPFTGDVVPEPTAADRRDAAPHSHDGHVDDGHAGHDQHAGHHGGDDDEHAGHDGHDAHGGHDHHDMMAIVGEPSADGLVMESIDFRFGPVGTPLPAGIAVDVTLDGDVVARCELRALLHGSPDAPDPLAPRAWERARVIAESGPDAWRSLAAAEVERAVSHLAWLRAFARVLGWPALVERAGAALAAVLEAGDLASAALDRARRSLAALTRFLEGSRWLRWRTRGRARVSAERARELGLSGPAARASGVAVDARAEDPLYRQLGFEPVVRHEGDVFARTLLRGSEAAAAVELAMRAVDATTPLEAPARAVVEGPRGPLGVTRAGSELRLDAPGAAAALAGAGAAAVGCEWAAAVVAIASFDVSPWRVSP
jgi:hypothetical protein